mgnify:CR=1 FL=1
MTNPEIEELKSLVEQKYGASNSFLISALRVC